MEKSGKVRVRESIFRLFSRDFNEKVRTIKIILKSEKNKNREIREYLVKKREERVINNLKQVSERKINEELVNFHRKSEEISAYFNFVF